MPFIHVKSSPPGGSLNLSEVVEGLSRDSAETTGLAIEHVTVTWELILADQYAVAGKVVKQQPADSHPALVDLLAPDFNSPE